MIFIIFSREKRLKAIFWGNIPVKQSNLLALDNSKLHARLSNIMVQLQIIITCLLYPLSQTIIS